MTNHTKEADKVLSLLKEINRATDTRFFMVAHEVMHMDLRIKQLEATEDELCIEINEANRRIHVLEQQLDANKRIKELEEQVDMADRKLLQMEQRLIGMSLKLPLHEFNRLTAEELITPPLWKARAKWNAAFDDTED